MIFQELEKLKQIARPSFLASLEGKTPPLGATAAPAIDGEAGGIQSGVQEIVRI